MRAGLDGGVGGVDLAVPMNVTFLCLLTEEEEEDEDNTELKAGLESDQKEDEESKDTKEGKMECATLHEQQHPPGIDLVHLTPAC